MPANQKTAFPSPQNFKKLSSGDCLFKAGDEGDSMFLVVDGMVAVVAEDWKYMEVAVLKKGEMLGEKAYITKGKFPRQFSVYAKTDCTLLEIFRENFPRIEDLIPGFSTRLIETLIRRLQRAERLIRVLEPVDKKRRVVLALLCFRGPNDQFCECLEDGTVNPLTVEKLQELTHLDISFILGSIENLIDDSILAERDGKYYLLDEFKLKEYGGVNS